MSENAMRFDGPCPFLTCLINEPHDHEICPECGAVRYGNLYCPTCQEYRPKLTLAQFLEQPEQEVGND